MRKTGKVTTGILLLIVVILCMTACGNSSSKLPDLSFMGKVNAISREDGSGTKIEFETLIGTSEAGVKAVGTSTTEVQEQVAEDKNALGYVAYSGILTNDNIKSIKVDGKELSVDNIQKDKYPLCRNYYLAYSGDLSALQQDFLSYVMSAGQNVVSKTCVPVKKTSTFLSDKSAGELTVMGSTSAAPLIEAMIKDYKNYNPSAKIKMLSSDSSQGLTSAIRGGCDFAVSSRDLKDYESELLTSKAFAKDGIAIIVNKENTVEDLTIKQIKAFYDGKCEKWGELQ
mgnify:FL=1